MIIIIKIDGYVDVTREFNNVPDGYLVFYDDSSMDYKIFNTRDEFFEFYSQDENEVQIYLDDLNFTSYIKYGEFY